MAKVCLLVCTYCPSHESEREALALRCLTSLRQLKTRYKNELFLVAWDNDSNDYFREHLQQQSWIDRLILNEDNFFDFGAIHALSLIADDLKIPYVIYCNDDIEFFDFNFLEECLALLSTEPSVGYIRLNIFDFNRLPIYDKDSSHPDRDPANSQRLYNWISKAPVHYKPIQSDGQYQYFLTNMHWTLFPGLCDSNVFTKLCPFRDHRPLQDLEGYMMTRYHELDLGTIQLNGGVCRHLGTTNLSMRLKHRKYPVISWEKCRKAIDAI